VPKLDIDRGGWHVRKWHLSDMAERSDHVRCSGQTGSRVSGPSGPVFDPMPTSGADTARSIGGPAARDAELTNSQGIEFGLRNFSTMMKRE
jgi:hypothetical protein